MANEFFEEHVKFEAHLGQNGLKRAKQPMSLCVSLFSFVALFRWLQMSAIQSW